MQLVTEEFRIIWGENIKLYRGKLKLTQRGLGAACSPPVRASSVNRWEKGKTNISDSHKIAVAEALGVDVRVLFPLARGPMA